MEDIIEESLSRVYELGYVLVPIIGDEGAEQWVTAIVDRIAQLGGTEITQGAPERIALAYEMARVVDNKRAVYNEGYFGWYKFEIDPSTIATLNEQLKADTSVLRHLLFKTVAESTFTPRKMNRRRTDRGDVVDEVVVTDADIAEVATDAVDTDDVVADTIIDTPIEQTEDAV